MKRKWHNLQGIMAAFGLLALILDSNLALKGARLGMELCIQTVIPSLFPFFVMSMLFTSSLSEHVASPVQVLTRFLGIPDASVSVWIPAIMGGYPVGAKCVSDFYQRNQISRSEAQWLLAFCSNAGPAFLFGMVSCFFPERKMIWQLWIIHIFSAVLTALAIPAKKADQHAQQSEAESQKTSIILSAAKAMGLVCCWVILFRTVIAFLDAWFLWIFPSWVQVLLIGILELTNGCCQLMLVTNVELRFVLCACMLSFGGICVLFQTASVTRGLSLGYYVKGKLIQTIFSFLLSYAVVEKSIVFPAVALLFLILCRKAQNRYSNSRILPV